MSELIDNRAHKIRTLKGIITELHRGADPEAVRRRLVTLVREVDGSEIAAMEQELIADGMAVEEVQSMCDLHSQVLRDIVVEEREPEVAPGHPVDTMQRENAAIEEAVAKTRRLAAELDALPDGASTGDLVGRLRQATNELLDVDKHYARKENLLFSVLERHGVTGPSKVMWAKDDEVRDLLRGLDEGLRAGPLAPAELGILVQTILEPALAAIAEMVFKEEQILLPMARQTLTEEEWGELWSQSPEYGWCLVEPREGWTPPASLSPENRVELRRDQAMVLPTGHLDLVQLRGMFAALPVDLTFVDADDRVRYFSDGPERIFARSKAIIGRKVQHCHPPKSVDTVERILSDFRAGRQSVAEFWIQLRGRFIHIRYFAVRDDDGRYLGTLEVTQDLTRLRALEGERRLLEYERAA